MSSASYMLQWINNLGICVTNNSLYSDLIEFILNHCFFHCLVLLLLIKTNEGVYICKGILPLTIILVNDNTGAKACTNVTYVCL
jgi:hypothetical protein